MILVCKYKQGAHSCTHPLPQALQPHTALGAKLLHNGKDHPLPEVRRATYIPAATHA